MSAPNRNFEIYSPEEYLGLLKASDRRFEYWNGEIVDMSSSWNHGVISTNLVAALHQKIRPGCTAFTGDLAVRPPGFHFFLFADAGVVCGPPQLENVEGIDAIANPILIAEVLSPTTERRDRNEKRKAYQSLPSLREYLLIDQTAANLVRYLKTGDLWQQDGASGIDGSLVLPSIQATLLLSELYNGVLFD
ncbi:MAG TPA: Uma2 family endonuclease [Blastocatellia bacterium]|nr:Uma2 family endonuclease [Blastocatellia bacterium]